MLEPNDQNVSGGIYGAFIFSLLSLYDRAHLSSIEILFFIYRLFYLGIEKIILC